MTAALLHNILDRKVQSWGIGRTDRLNDLSYDIKIRTNLSSILSQITRLVDGRTDGQTEFLSLDRVCIPCSAVIMQSRPRLSIPSRLTGPSRLLLCSCIENSFLSTRNRCAVPSSFDHKGVEGCLVKLRQDTACIAVTALVVPS